MRQIDSISHQLNTMQIARLVLEAFDDGESCVHIVCMPQEVHKLPGQLRNSISKHFRQNKIDSGDRIGIRTSEPFPCSFHDDREGRFMCISVTPYYSQFRAMSAAVADIFKDISL